MSKRSWWIKFVGANSRPIEIGQLCFSTKLEEDTAMFVHSGERLDLSKRTKRAKFLNVSLLFLLCLWLLDKAEAVRAKVKRIIK